MSVSKEAREYGLTDKSRFSIRGEVDLEAPLKSKGFTSYFDVLGGLNDETRVKKTLWDWTRIHTGMSKGGNTQGGGRVFIRLSILQAFLDYQLKSSSKVQLSSEQLEAYWIEKKTTLNQNTRDPWGSDLLLLAGLPNRIGSVFEDHPLEPAPDTIAEFQPVSPSVDSSLLSGSPLPIDLSERDQPGREAYPEIGIKATIDSRGDFQRKFKMDQISRWGGCCSVTGVECAEILIASHIKPWAQSNGNEKVDPSNGLLLTPNLDKLFDKSLISFRDSGEIILSSKISSEEYKLLGISPEMRLRRVDEGMKYYLQEHRKQFYETNA